MLFTKCIPFLYKGSLPCLESRCKKNVEKLKVPPFKSTLNTRSPTPNGVGLLVVGEDGFARLRASHGRTNSPPDCLLGPAFRIHPPNTHTKPKHQPLRLVFWFGGGGRIRTIEAIRSRFTVCPLWPLGNSPRYSISVECLSGAGRRTRTPDLLITNQLLYQLSYTGGSNRTRLL